MNKFRMSGFFTILLLNFVLLVLSCSDSEEQEDPAPEEEVTLEGNYIGTWDDNIYTNFPISTILTQNPSGGYTGPFFYSQLGSFTPCCNDAENNGTISFDVEGDSILNFRYNQRLEFFMGGCPGLYTGKGILIGTTLNISFTGNDCEGEHTGGRIVLRK